MKHIRSSFAVLCAVLTAVSSFAADTPPEGVTLVDLTGTGKGTASSMYATGWTGGSAATVFDNDFDNRSIYNSQTLDWRWTFNEPTVVNAYKMYACTKDFYFYDRRMPKSWKFEGKNTADADWTTLDTRSNETELWGIKEGRYFQCDNNVAYDMYRVVSTATIEGGSGYTQIAELEFFHVLMGPKLSDAAFTKTSDGVWTFTATATSGSGTLSLVFSSDEADSVEMDLGSFSEGDSISKPIVIAETDLRTDVVYTLKTVAANDDGTTEEALPGDYYFGIYATPADALYSFTVTVPDGFSKSLTDYAFPVRLSTDITGFDYSHSCQSGKDIIVKDEDGNELSYELASWNPDGASILWVKALNITAGSKFTVYYGFSRRAKNSPRAVWNGFAGVWHLDETDAAGSAGDSTKNGLDATPGAAMLSVAGPVGQARYTNKASLNVPNYDSLKLGSTFTVSGWFKLRSANSYPRYMTRKAAYTDTNGWEIEMSNGSKTKMSARGASSTSVSITASADMDLAWNLLTLVYNNTTLTVYVNGVQKATGTIAAATDNGRMMYFAGSSLDADIDELRLEGDCRSAGAIAADYYFGSTALTYSEAKLQDDTAVVFANPTATVAVGSGVTVTIPVVSGEGDVSVVYNGDESGKVALGTISATPCNFVDTPSVPADTIWAFSAYGANTKGTVTRREAECGVLNGVVSAEKVSDAKEDGLVSGTFTVSRPDAASACTYPLVVNLAWGGTAVAGKNYVDNLPTAVTIPEGESSVSITVTPLIDSTSTQDETLTLTVLSGPYRIGTAATMTIVNLVTPDGWNTWVAPAAGKASVASNWSAGHTPTTSEKVLFDGRFSNAKCEWDADAAHTVAAWRQTNGYTAMVEFDTEFPTYDGATFPLFTVSGDCEILTGGWTHRGNYNNYGAAKENNTSKLAAKRWCINVTVGGNLTIASGASIDVTGKGFGYDGSGKSPCYGGYGFDSNLQCQPYGSIVEPFDPGMGARAQGDQTSQRSGTGGGAVKLVVSGAVTVNGSVLAVGTIDLCIPRSGGTGGSIWINANQISGSGTINASGCQPSYFNSDCAVGPGSGGRIALYTKSALAIARDNLICNGSSYGGTSGSSKTKIASAGTIFIKDPSMDNGVLLLKQEASVATANSAKSAVPLMGDMTLDAVELAGCVILVVETDKTLTLPGGFASVTSDNTTIGANGISLRGGAINVGSGNQTISGWMLEPETTFAFPANASLVNNGAIGIIRRNICGTEDAPIPPRTVAFTVAGDMSIDSTSAVDVSSCCNYTHYESGVKGGWYGGWTTYYNKLSNQTNAQTKTYGSVFNPADSGSSPGREYKTGGVVTMTVAGELAIAGTVTANGPASDSTSDNAAPSSAGSINMTVGSLTGLGTISAIGGAGRYCYAGGGGGGRIAIRLTDGGATVPGGIIVNAQGRYGNVFNVKCDKIGSAGTVYVETAADGAKGGTITVSNWKDRTIAEFTSATVIPTTPIVAYNGGDSVADFKGAKLVVTNNAIAEVSVAALTMRTLEIASGSKLDLDGNKLTVSGARLNGTKLKPGTYTAASEEVEGYVTDSGSGGELIVKANGLVILIQ